MMDETVVRTAAQLKREGRAADALRVVRDALVRNALPPEDVARAGRLIGSIFAESDGLAPKRLRVRVAGESTSCWVADCLAAIGWAAGTPLVVDAGNYDNVLQDV